MEFPYRRSLDNGIWRDRKHTENTRKRDANKADETRNQNRRNIVAVCRTVMKSSSKRNVKSEKSAEITHVI